MIHLGYVVSVNPSTWLATVRLAGAPNEDVIATLPFGVKTIPKVNAAVTLFHHVQAGWLVIAMYPPRHISDVETQQYGAISDKGRRVMEAIGLQPEPNDIFVTTEGYPWLGLIKKGAKLYLMAKERCKMVMDAMTAGVSWIMRSLSLNILGFRLFVGPGTVDADGTAKDTSVRAMMDVGGEPCFDLFAGKLLTGDRAISFRAFDKFELRFSPESLIVSQADGASVQVSDGALTVTLGESSCVMTQESVRVSGTKVEVHGPVFLSPDEDTQSDEALRYDSETLDFRVPVTFKGKAAILEEFLATFNSNMAALRAHTHVDAGSYIGADLIEASTEATTRR